MQSINVSNDASQRMRTILGGQNVRLKIKWVEAGELWEIELSEQDGTPIASGLRLQSGYPVMRSILTDFVGDIVAIPLATPETDLGRNAWGQTHKLVYVTDLELEEQGF